MSNAKDFVFQIKQWANGIPADVQKVHRMLTIEGLRRIGMRTPIDTGHATRNWQVGVTDRPEGVVGKRPKKAKGTPPAEKGAVMGVIMAAGVAKANEIPPFGISHITNNVEYVADLEDGSSRQAPQGMVSLSVEELSRLKL